MTEDIVHEATYPHSPETVWRVLTTPAAMGAWLMETDFQGPTVGHRFTFRDKPRLGWSGVTACEVLEADAPRRLVFSFGDESEGSPTTRVAWELEPVGGGTRVRFRHSGFTGFKGWMMRQGMNHGWRRIVGHSIPYVIDTMLSGSVPTREATRAAAKERSRSEHAARRAQP